VNDGVAGCHMTEQEGDRFELTTYLIDSYLDPSIIMVLIETLLSNSMALEYVMNVFNAEYLHEQHCPIPSRPLTVGLRMDGDRDMKIAEAFQGTAWDVVVSIEVSHVFLSRRR
jgi:hypothetical protein